jgi:hypothetical protein
MTGPALHDHMEVGTGLSVGTCVGIGVYARVYGLHGSRHSSVCARVCILRN